MKKIIYLVLAGLIIFLDQASKHWAIVHLDEYPWSLLPVLDLRLAFNHGVAFSMFYAKGAQTPWLLIVLTLMLSTLVLYLLIQSRDKIHQTAYAMILGGAIANIIDRVRYGAVIDFIDAHIKTYHWPVFNVADSFICVGAFLLILFMNKKENS